MTSSWIAYYEFYVQDVEASAAQWTREFGLTEAFRDEAVEPTRSIGISQGSVRLLLTQDERPGSAPAEFLAQHGEGLATIALASGARVGSPDGMANGDRPRFARAGNLISGAGGVSYRFVSPDVVDLFPEHSGRYRAVDHLALCVPTGDLDSAVAWHVQELGLAKVFEERISIGAQAMNSAVVQAAHGDLTLTVIEPAERTQPGQISRFLESHRGAGVQHLALSTDDIAAAVEASKAGGVEFLDTPDAYYDSLAQRLGRLPIDLDRMRETRILADRDPDGELFQIFARSRHQRGTFFVELIERLGARTFGTANIRALYEAVERDRSRVSAQG